MCIHVVVGVRRQPGKRRSRDEGLRLRQLRSGVPHHLNCCTMNRRDYYVKMHSRGRSLCTGAMDTLGELILVPLSAFSMRS